MGRPMKKDDCKKEDKAGNRMLKRLTPRGTSSAAFIRKAQKNQTGKQLRYIHGHREEKGSLFTFKRKSVTCFIPWNILRNQSIFRGREIEISSEEESDEDEDDEEEEPAKVGTRRSSAKKVKKTFRITGSFCFESKPCHNPLCI